MPDAQSPSAVSDTALQAASVPSASAPSDSAPPPTSPQPAPRPVPPRTYPQGPVYLAPPPAYAPNSAVPNFLRLVAAVVLIGGTLSSACTWVYKTILYPRLVVALQARVQLFRSHETIYGRLHYAVKNLVLGAGIRRLGGTAAVEFRERERRRRREGAEEAGADPAGREGVEQEKERSGSEAEKEPLLERAGSGLEDRADGAPTAADEEAAALPPAPRILEPVQASLKSLRTEVVSGSPSSNPTVLANPSNLVQPQGMLLRSLVTLNEYLESESYAASTFHTYRPYGAYGAGSGGASTATGERKTLQEVTHNFKAEIRSIKGALLNRRNFARPSSESAAASGP